MPSAPAKRLARLIAQRRLQGEARLSLDAYARHGRGDAHAREDADRSLVAQIPATAAAIIDLVGSLRDTDVAALNELIAGQLTLLDAFSATQPEGSTERSVAEQEAEAWEQVRSGERDSVHQNTHYVRQDAALFEQIFGFSPGTPGADEN